MKVVTRRYAKRQVQWLRNKLLPAVNAANAISQTESKMDITPTYLLDATGEGTATRCIATNLCHGLELGDAWSNRVQAVAERITDSKS